MAAAGDAKILKVGATDRHRVATKSNKHIIRGL